MLALPLISDFDGSGKLGRTISVNDVGEDVSSQYTFDASLDSTVDNELDIAPSPTTV